MRRRTLLALPALMFLGAAGCGSRVASRYPTDAYMNPIMNSGADPWVIRSGDMYYLTMTTGNNVTIWASKDLTNIAQGQSAVVWTPSGGFADIWAPELHHIGSRWYIYFAADQRGDNATHRMYVLESMTEDPMGPYLFAGQIASADNHWAIDGTVLTVDTKLYFVWSGWAATTSGPQNLYIAPMRSPVAIRGPRVEISAPTYEWETSHAAINEGPEALVHNGKVFIIYSANASWTNAYCLGQLTLQGSDPLQASQWIKSSEPVFQSSDTVFGPGHASYTLSPEHHQHWIVYHAAQYKGAGWTRNVRTQPFSWAENGDPAFGTPDPITALGQAPSGEPTYRQLTEGQAIEESYRFTIRTAKAGTHRLWVHYSNAGPATNAALRVPGRASTDIALASTTKSTSYFFTVASAVFPEGLTTATIDLQHLPLVDIDAVWVSVDPIA